MKKITLLLVMLAGMMINMASAQLLPTFQFGIKGGVNLSNISTSGQIFNNLNTDNRAGFLGGVWARIGGAGLHFQPEVYYTSKNVTLHDDAGNENKAEFRSIDVPLLIGTRFGVPALGVRINTGPLVSFAIDKNQSFNSAAGSVYDLHYKDQNYAWQFGAGVDIRSLSFDLRYELGLSKVDSYTSPSQAKINMFNLTVAYRLFGL